MSGATRSRSFSQVSTDSTNLKDPGGSRIGGSAIGGTCRPVSTRNEEGTKRHGTLKGSGRVRRRVNGASRKAFYTQKARVRASESERVEESVRRCGDAAMRRRQVSRLRRQERRKRAAEGGACTPS